MRAAILRPAAAADVEDARRWYEVQLPGLGEEFLAAVTAAMNLILDLPHAFPVVYRGTGRAVLSRFPYGLFYRVIDDRIVVVACLHLRREPRIWRRRR